MQKSVLIPIGMIAVAVAGCAEDRRLAEVQRENEALKAKVTELESQIAQRSADEQAPVVVNGLALVAPEVEELCWTPAPPKASPPREQERSDRLGHVRFPAIDGEIPAGAIPPAPLRVPPIEAPLLIHPVPPTPGLLPDDRNSPATLPLQGGE